MNQCDKIILNDVIIRNALLLKLRSQQAKPKAIIEELRVHNGNAIADVVALHSEAHCYEIKGFADKVERIQIQGEYYNSSFRRITLVITTNHLEKALKLAPSFWGIMIAEIKGPDVSIKSFRRASNNRNFSKEIALQTLWKSEMLGILKEDRHKRQPREVLAQLISKTTRKAELSNFICEVLLERSSASMTKCH